MSKCQHCNEPNPEGMFNCPSCGLRAAPNKWNTNFVIRENNSWATAIRKDQIDFKHMSMEDGVKRMKETNKNAKPAPSGKGIRVM
tara:strand:+ start:1790 stop:2044 length:255 start_codon:yes stop_codon:yes gene_type:complete